MWRGRNPYECFKSDRHRLLALVSRDLRLVVVAAIMVAAGLAGVEVEAWRVITTWLG